MTGSQWAEEIVALLSGDPDILEAYVVVVETFAAIRRREKRKRKSLASRS